MPRIHTAAPSTAALLSPCHLPPAAAPLDFFAPVAVVDELPAVLLLLVVAAAAASRPDDVALALALTLAAALLLVVVVR